jgi:hypothetical protein
LREYTEEIKKLKMMLEGKLPMAMVSPSAPQAPVSGEIVYQDRIVYREGENK